MPDCDVGTGWIIELLRGDENEDLRIKGWEKKRKLNPFTEPI